MVTDASRLERAFIRAAPLGVVTACADECHVYRFEGGCSARRGRNERSKSALRLSVPTTLSSGIGRTNVAARRGPKVLTRVATDWAHGSFRRLGNIRAALGSLWGDSRYLSDTKGGQMKALFLTVGALTAALALTIGLNGAWASSDSAAARTTVSAASSSLGRILVDGRGHTLYLFAKDTRGRSSCAGACAAAWPPLIASGKPLAAAGAKASLLGTTRRADGRLQVTYGHHPLYLFVNDAKKGETNGQAVDAFGAEWYALTPAGARIATAAMSGGAPASGGGYGNGGYGY